MAGVTALAIPCSQYFPLFGELRMFGEPWSPARRELIPGHLAVFFGFGVLTFAVLYNVKWVVPKRSERPVLLVSLLCLGIALVAIAGTLLQPMRAAEQERLRQAQEEATLRSLAGEQTEVEAQFSARRAEVRTLGRLLANTREVPELLRRFSTLARESDLEVLRFTPLAPRDTLNVDWLVEEACAFSIEGNYLSIVRFLDQLGKLQRTVVFSDFTIELKPVVTGESNPEESLRQTMADTGWPAEEIEAFLERFGNSLSAGSTRERALSFEGHLVLPRFASREELAESAGGSESAMDDCVGCTPKERTARQRLDASNQRLQALDEKVALVGQLRARRWRALRLLNVVSETGPDSLRLTTLAEREDRVTVRGTVARASAVSEFVAQLESSDWLVAIEVADHGTQADGAEVAFSLTAQYGSTSSSDESPSIEELSRRDLFRPVVSEGPPGD